MFYWNILSEKRDMILRTKIMCLNPCFTGISFRRYFTSPIQLITNRLNPCFTGISFRRHNGKGYLFRLFGVLILVLLEYPFGGKSVWMGWLLVNQVLILVLLEYPFGVLIFLLITKIERLNPCFTGISFRSLRFASKPKN